MLASVTATCRISGFYFNCCQCRLGCIVDYSYAGLDRGTECYCGNSGYGRHGPRDESECKYPCKGDHTQICGGYYVISVYDTRYGKLPIKVKIPFNRDTIWVDLIKPYKNYIHETNKLHRQHYVIESST